MQIHRSALRRLALSTILLVLPAASAHALDTNAFGDRLKAVMLAQGVNIEWTNLTENGTQIVLEGVTVGIGDKAEKGNIGNVTLDDVTDENGGFKIGKVTLPDYSTTEEGMTVDVSGVTLAGLTLPAESATDPMSSMLIYSNADLAKMTVKKGDTDSLLARQAAFRDNALRRRQADGIFRQHRKILGRPDPDRGPAVQGGHRGAGLPADQRRPRDERLVEPGRRHASDSRNTTSPSTMPARSA